MRKLDILVPIYNEGEEVIKDLLNSIAIQQAVDLKNDIAVIVCCDGGATILTEDFVQRYPFKIEFYQCEHRGVSATRNSCLDHAEAEYVLFADCDDIFYNACGLWIIMQHIEKGFDSMVSVFVEEWKDRETGEIKFLNRERDNVFVHGKVHRRQYLIDKNIRWNENLTIHEDSYFNTLCQALSEDVIYVTAPFYLWRWRDASVCRHDKKYILKTYSNLLDSNEALAHEFLNRGMEDLAQSFITMMVFDAYYTMNKPAWINQENKEYRDKVEERFTKYFRDNKDLWDSIPMEKKMKISNNVRTRSVGEGMLMEKITIEQWLEGRT